MRAGIAALALTLLGGCVSLADDGFYGCKHSDGLDAICPADHTCRWDDRCWSGPERGAELAEACEDDRDCATGLICAPSFSGMMPHAYCTLACDVDADCDRPDAPDMLCIQDECLVVCDPGPGTSECSGGTSCLLLMDLPPEMDGGGGHGPLSDYLCAAVAEPEYDGHTGCSGMNCPPPGFCVTDGTRGICSLRCQADPDCPMDGRCYEFGGWGQCLFPCGSDADCDGLVCRAVTIGGEAVDACIPAEWDGMDPLPGMGAMASMTMM